MVLKTFLGQPWREKPRQSGIHQLVPMWMLFFSSMSLFAQPQESLPVNETINLININPDPNGEPWIAGGINKATWDSAISAMPELGPAQQRLGKTLAKPLPSKVDNTALPCFRPIFNQQGGSCSQASSIGYVYTYEINSIRGLAANTPDNQYPYDFTYNFINAGSGNNGGLPEQAWAIVLALGVPNVTSYGGFGLGKFSQWVSGYPLYYNAMTNRLASYFRINTSTPAGVTQMKQWLNDRQNGDAQGGCLVMCYYSVTQALGSIPAGLPEAGKKIMYKFGTTGGHAVTIAGYNDSVRYDFNGDGKYSNSNPNDVKTWEIGAYLMVNSWGASFGNSGKVWIPYRMLAISNGIWSSTLYGMKTQTEKTFAPQLTYKIVLKHSKRNQLRLRAGYANSATATSPTSTPKTFASAFNYAGGAYAMQGTNSNPIEIGLDVSDFAQKLTTGEVSLFLLVDSKGGTGSVAGFSLMDYSNGATPVEIACLQTNVNLPIGTTTLKITKTQKALMVLTPNGGEKLERGRTFGITWNDHISENVKIELLKGNIAVSTIAASAPSSGSYDWAIPADQAIGSDYQVKITGINNASAFDVSDSDFTIQEKSALEVTSPAGGEFIEKGKIFPISWNTNISGNVKIDLFKDKMPETTLVASAAASAGSFSWTPSTAIHSGYTYTVRITSVSNALVYDESKAFFSIVNPLVAAPYTQTFDGFASQSSALRDGWEQSVDDDIDWTVYSGPSPSRADASEGGTGPTGDHTSGKGNYLYVEASGINNTPAKDAELLSPMLITAGIGSIQIGFWYHMYSKDAHMGSLLLDVFANNVWKDSALQLSGDKGDKWQEQVVQVNQLFPQFSAPITKVQVRFRATTGAAYDSDICIDDFRVSGNATKGFPIDASIASRPLVKRSGDRIVYSAANGELRIITLNGAIMMHAVVKGTGSVNISKLPQGVFLATLNNETVKFIR